MKHAEKKQSLFSWLHHFRQHIQPSKRTPDKKNRPYSIDMRKIDL
jgi:hypothetical protein